VPDWQDTSWGASVNHFGHESHIIDQETQKSSWMRVVILIVIVMMIRLELQWNTMEWMMIMKMAQISVSFEVVVVALVVELFSFVFPCVSDSVFSRSEIEKGY
jgi:type III secretory pathway component EscU